MINALTGDQGRREGIKWPLGKESGLNMRHVAGKPCLS
jgi:hypothetical protein